MASSSTSKPEESDEEPDYLSDDFLAQCVKQDVRPGLMFRPKDKRVHEQYKRKLEEDDINQKEKKSRSLEEGLKKEIGEENKGFRMLQKMGFTPGSSLGKKEGGGIKVPITVELKNNRTGIGHKSKKEVGRMKIEEWKKEREKLMDTDQFRSRLQTETVLKETLGDLRRAQKACQNLDSNAEVESPIQPWFWPEIPKKKVDEAEEEYNKEIIDEEEEDKEEDTLTPEEKLVQVESYLRSHYFYCIWCGVKYDGEEDLKNCPGDDRQSH